MDQMDKKYKVQLAKLDTVVHGSLAELADVPDVVGKVVLNETQEVVSDCTALSVVVNESRRDWTERFNALVNSGHNPNRVLNWFGTPKTIYEIISNCQSRSCDVAQNPLARSVFVAKPLAIPAPT